MVPYVEDALLALRAVVLDVKSLIGHAGEGLKL